MPAPLAKLLLLAGATAPPPADPTSLQRPAPLPAVAADNSWRSALPGEAPPNLKYLGAWTANEYPDYPIHFLNLGLQVRRSERGWGNVAGATRLNASLSSGRLQVPRPRWRDPDRRAGPRRGGAAAGGGERRGWAGGAGAGRARLLWAKHAV